MSQEYRDYPIVVIYRVPGKDAMDIEFKGGAAEEYGAEQFGHVIACLVAASANMAKASLAEMLMETEKCLALPEHSWVVGPDGKKVTLNLVT